MQSPEHSMPTHEHKQTHTNTHRHNYAKQSHTPTRSLALWLFKWILLFPRLEFVYLSIVFEAFDVWQSARTGPESKGPLPPSPGPPSHNPTRAGRKGWRGLFLPAQRTEGHNLKHTLPMSSASISVNYSLVSSGIIQTASANVNELLFAYLYFLCWNVIDYYVLRWWMPLLIHSDM